MIQNDGLSIPDNYLEEWSREIARWVNVNLDNMFARNMMPVRKVDEAVRSTLLWIMTEQARAPRS